MENTAGQALYDLLITRDFEPELLDSAGKQVTDANEAELFSFDWKTTSQNYGTVVILMGNDNELEIYFGDNLGRGMEGDDKAQWYKFLEQIKQFATRNLMTFEINNLNRLKYTMQGMAAIKEGLFEGYYGTKNTSYSDQPKKTRLIIKHSRNLGEGEARFRNIESLFVETDQGERFKLPFTKLLGGRAMARHCSEGGTPYDTFGQYIGQLVNEMNTLARFVRASKNRQFANEAAEMIESAVRHYQDLKAKAKRMVSKRGYLEEKNNFNPAEFTDTEVTVDAIRDMFIEQSLDQRIEEALPILVRLKEEDDTMKEVNQFESWVNQVSEGTWSLPDTFEKEKRLKDLTNTELFVGPDAMNAEEQLYDLIGDDLLFDILDDLANTDPDANIWENPRVLERLAQLGIKITSADKQTEPAAKSTSENIDTDGIMRTVPSNMSSESITRLKHLIRI